MHLPIFRKLLPLPTRRIEAEGSDEDSISFSQLTLNNAYLNNPGELVALLEDCLHGDMGLIARAKGTIPAGSETLRFDLADGLYSISGSPETTNQCVFIGLDLEKEKLLKRLGALFDAKKVSLTRAYVNRHQESQLP